MKLCVHYDLEIASTAPKRDRNELDPAYICYMSEALTIIQGTKQEQYERLLPQVEALISYETDRIANLANVVASLKAQFDGPWVGF